MSTTTTPEGANPAVYRPFLTNPGESLLLARNAVDFVHRVSEFVTATGIDQADVISDPIVALPIPVYRTDFTGRRWPGMSPRMMWHPLMWLPDELASRFPIKVEAPDGSGVDTLEPDDIYAVRVAIELGLSGLYDADSGMWLDVLSLVGLDITSEADQARVAAWMQGAADATLDSIDLRGYFLPDATEALKDAATNIFALRRASAAAIASSLLVEIRPNTERRESERADAASLALVGSALRVDQMSADPDRSAELWARAIQVLSVEQGAAPVSDDVVRGFVEAIERDLEGVVVAHGKWLADLSS